jgi:hypothetical protein
MTLAAGIHDAIPEDVYHADHVADVPTLSASVARVLVNRSPLHAWNAHPKLNPDAVTEHRKEFTRGNALHGLLLEADAKIDIVEADNWRTKAAQEARDESLAAGRNPMLPQEADAVEQMAAAVNKQLDALPIEPRPFTLGKPEQTLVWEDHGVLCRSRVDWLFDDHRTLDDLKSTSRSANPEQWSRQLFGMGYEIQARMYVRAVTALTGVEAEWRWVVVETEPPFAVSVIGMPPAAAALADQKIDYALAKWAECLRTGVWPGYPQQVCYAEPPGWAESQWLDRVWTEMEAA